MDAPRPGRRYTPEEYLAYERQAPYKNEYIAGQIVAVSGTTHVHHRIAMNVARILSTQTLDGPCEAYGSDLRVKIGIGRLYTYPDLTLVCAHLGSRVGQTQARVTHDAIHRLLPPTGQTT